MRKALHTLAIASALVAGLIAVSPLYAEDSHDSSGSNMGSGMMGGGGMMGMMNMMQTMNRMMETCTDMMESAMNRDQGPAVPDKPSPKGATPDKNG